MDIAKQLIAVHTYVMSHSVMSVAKVLKEHSGNSHSLPVKGHSETSSKVVEFIRNCITKDISILT